MQVYDIHKEVTHPNTEQARWCPSPYLVFFPSTTSSPSKNSSLVSVNLPVAMSRSPRYDPNAVAGVSSPPCRPSSVSLERFAGRRANADSATSTVVPERSAVKERKRQRGGRVGELEQRVQDSRKGSEKHTTSTRIPRIPSSRHDCAYMSRDGRAARRCGRGYVDYTEHATILDSVGSE